MRGSHGKLRALALSIAALAVVTVSLEVTLRLTHLFGARVSWSQPDDTLGWRYTPHREFWYHAENDHPIEGRINGAGWRDVDHALEKQAGVYRVVILGDSFVEALQVELDSTFWRLAEKKLARRIGRPVEIINLARSGMTQTEQLIVLRTEAVRYAPDLVVQVFVPVNDVADVNPETADSALRPFFRVGADGDLRLDTSFNVTREYRLKRAINAFKQRSALLSLIVERYNVARRAGRVGTSRPPGDARISGALSLCTDSPDSVFAHNYELNRRLLVESAFYCRRNGMDYLLVCADWVYKAEDIARYRNIDESFDPAWFEDDLARLADSVDAGYLGLQRVFARRYAATGRPLHWAHWNYEGHRVVAEALTGAIAERIDAASGR